MAVLRCGACRQALRPATRGRPDRLAVAFWGTAAKVVTDAAGRFRVKLAPGEYLIIAEASGARCEPLRVSVPAGSFESVRLLCDLGIR